MATWADLGIDIPYGATGETRAICPQCGGAKRKPENRRDKDLAVNLTDGVYFCHHCDFHGNINSASPDWRESRVKRYEAPRPLPSGRQPRVLKRQ